MLYLLQVDDKRTNHGLGTRRYETAYDAVNYIKNHRVYQVTVISNGYATTLTASKFVKIHSWREVMQN